MVPMAGAVADLVEAARARVHRPLVHRDVQHPRVVVEDVLRAVAVVGVVVDDQPPARLGRPARRR